YPAGVGSVAFQPHRYPGRDRVIAIDARFVIEVIDDHVKVAVIVEVGQAHPLGNADGVKTPRGAGILKSEIAAITKGHLGRGEAWIGSDQLPDFLGRELASRARLLHARRHVSVLKVAQLTVGNEYVLEAIEVHVQ